MAVALFESIGRACDVQLPPQKSLESPDAVHPGHSAFDANG
jgi:hypothetical protein